MRAYLVKLDGWNNLQVKLSMGPNAVNLTITIKITSNEKKVTVSVNDKQEYKIVFSIKCKLNTFILAS